MTDIETTKLCEDSMGIPAKVIGEIGVAYEYSVWPGKQLKYYDPLHDDAQAMALVKKFRLSLVYAMNYTDKAWTCESYRETSLAAESATNQDLNRAICECVAKMQRRKQS